MTSSSYALDSCFMMAFDNFFSCFSSWLLALLLLEYFHIDINDNAGQQSPPLLLMEIFFFYPPLTSMAKECSGTTPIKQLLFFMNSRPS